MYSPKIYEKPIPVLYRISKQVKKPMTTLVNEAVSDFISKVMSLNASEKKF